MFEVFFFLPQVVNDTTRDVKFVDDVKKVNENS